MSDELRQAAEYVLRVHDNYHVAGEPVPEFLGTRRRFAWCSGSANVPPR